jgi:malate dehydrogenase (oxaloacetate-decarboxylating)
MAPSASLVKVLMTKRYLRSGRRVSASSARSSELHLDPKTLRDRSPPAWHRVRTGTDAMSDRVARAERPAEDALRLHPQYRGKIQIAPKCPVRGSDDLAIWYSPGVAAACKAIVRDPDQIYEMTNKGNTIAVVSDGTRVLGLGEIGPEAGLPVMEGKALLFKYLGGVDAVPLCLDTRDADELVRTVTVLQPSFGGINLEDIAQPKCFRVLAALRRSLRIPVWHDDQQGTATVLLAALENALARVGKTLGGVRITLVGAGAAGFATYRLLRAAGADPGSIVVCDRKGAISAARQDLAAERDLFVEKAELCRDTNRGQVADGIAAALRGADVCISFACPGPGVIQPAWVRTMARDAIVFACANPTPEIWPWEASEAGARIVGTGRSDFPNQVNNSLGFPGIFRGVLDVRARAISDEMAIAAARALAGYARERGLRDDAILPPMDDPEVVVREAIAVGLQAIAQGLAAHPMSADELRASAIQKVGEARATMTALMEAGVIAAPR